jgi:hypothetical protein
MLLARIVATLAILTGVFYDVANTGHWLMSGEAAGMQFSNSDAAALTNTAVQSSLNVVSGSIGLVALALLVLIWWKPVKALLSN